MTLRPRVARSPAWATEAGSAPDLGKYAAGQRDLARRQPSRPREAVLRCADLVAKVHDVAAVGVEASEADALGQGVLERRYARDRVDRFAAVLGHGTRDAKCWVAWVGVHGDTRVDDPAHLLVELRPARDRLDLRLGALCDVPLEPGRTHEARREPVAQVRRAPRAVCCRGADVSSHELGREQQLGPALDVLAFDRVVRVARPDAVGHGEDAKVAARPAARARLDLETGVLRLELVDQALHRDGLRVRAWAADMHRLDEVAVVVPLDEVDPLCDRLPPTQRSARRLPIATTSRITTTESLSKKRRADQPGSLLHLEGAPRTGTEWASTIPIIPGQGHFSGQRHELTPPRHETARLVGLDRRHGSDGRGRPGHTTK